MSASLIRVGPVLKGACLGNRYDEPVSLKTDGEWSVSAKAFHRKFDDQEAGWNWKLIQR